MRPVYSSFIPVDCEVLKSYLETHGIQAVVLNEHSALAENAAGPPTLWIVNDEDELRALQIIAQRGKEDPSLPPWRCERCKEENEGPFGVCWKCRSPAPPLAG